MFNGLPSQHKLDWIVGPEDPSIDLCVAEAHVGSVIVTVHFIKNGLGYCRWELDSDICYSRLITLGDINRVQAACLEAEDLILKALDSMAISFGKRLCTRPDVREPYPFSNEG